MAAPRKRKREPPFDVTGIDFSVITTALKTGGKMIEQIINGIQYGSPEVRLLMLEECDFILECRVCRGLFRALPNFIAHKRVYCCEAYCNHGPDVQFQAATAFEPPQKETVWVTPTAAEDVSGPDPGQRENRDDSKEKDKEKGVCGKTTSGQINKATRNDLSESRTRADCGQADKNSAETALKEEDENNKDGAQTRSKSSNQTKDQLCAATLSDGVRKVLAGEMIETKEFVTLTAAAEKMDHEKLVEKSVIPLLLTPIPASPVAVYVNSGNTKHPNCSTEEVPSASNIVPVVEKVEKRAAKTEGDGKLATGQTLVPQTKISSSSTVPASGSRKSTHRAVPNVELSVKSPSACSKTASNANTVAAASVKTTLEIDKTSTKAKAGAHKGPVGISKGTLRNVTRVVRELRQKKGESASKEQVTTKNEANPSVQKGVGTSVQVASKQSPSLTASRPELRQAILNAGAGAIQVSKKIEETGKLHIKQSSAAGAIQVSKKIEETGKLHIKQSSAALGDRATGDQSAEEGGSLRAVVKRCLTGRPWALRTSPHKSGSMDRSSDVDSVSEAGSLSERGDGPSTQVVLRQREDGVSQESPADLDNLRCTICKIEFSQRKSLVYHCQTRHSGQRTIYPCPYCQRVFYYFWGLTRHLHTNHNKNPSDIDRMRKSLRRRAYKQNVTDMLLDSGREPLSDDGGKTFVSLKPRPSLCAKKAVAVSKPTDPLEQDRPVSVMTVMPSRRRRVEVISPVRSKSKRSVDIYRKVYPNKRTGQVSEDTKVMEAPSPAKGEQPRKTGILSASRESVSSRQKLATLATVLSSPSKESVSRRKKLVARALRVTRSKRVHDAAAPQSPPPPPSSREADKQLTAGSSSQPAKAAVSAEESKASRLDQELTASVLPPLPQQASKPLTAVKEGSTLKVSTDLGVSRRSTLKNSTSLKASTGLSISGRSTLKVSTDLVISSRRSASRTTVLKHISVKDEIGKETASSLTLRRETAGVMSKSEGVSVAIEALSVSRDVSAGERGSRVVNTGCLSQAGIKASTTAVSYAPSDDRSGTVSQNCTQVLGPAVTLMAPYVDLLPHTRTRTSAQAASSLNNNFVEMSPANNYSLTPSSMAAHSEPSSPSLLNVCPHCQRAFGRKISLDSHIKVCSKARLAAKPDPKESDDGVEITGGKAEADSSRGGERFTIADAVSGSGTSLSGVSCSNRGSVERPSSRNSRERSAKKVIATSRELSGGKLQKVVEGRTVGDDRHTGSVVSKTVTRTRSEDKSSTNKISAISSSREGSVDSEPRTTSQPTERPSRAGSRADSKGGSSRDSSVDSFRTRSSDTRLQWSSADSSTVPSRDKSTSRDRTSADSVSCTVPSRDKSTSRNRTSADSVSSAVPSRAVTCRDKSTSRHRTPTNSVSSTMPSRDKSTSRDGSAASQNKAPPSRKPEENLLTLSRLRLSEQLQAAATTQDNEGLVEIPLSQHSRPKAAKGLAAMRTGGVKHISKKTVTTTVLRKTSRERFSEPTKNLHWDSRSGVATRSHLPTDKDIGMKGQLVSDSGEGIPVRSKRFVVQVTRDSTEMTSSTEGSAEPLPKAGSCRRKFVHCDTSEVRVVKPDIIGVDARKSGGSQQTVTLTGPPVKQQHALTAPPVHQQQTLSQVTAPPAKQQQTATTPPAKQLPKAVGDEGTLRPRRKRRAPSRILENSDNHDDDSESNDSSKKLMLDPELNHDDKTDVSYDASNPGGLEKTISPTIVTAEAGDGGQNKDTGDDAVKLVEEIWMEKKPGRPTERVKSNRIYVVELAHYNRLTCQDTRKVGQIVNETGLTCLQCDQHFTSVSNLRRHAIRHLGWKRFKCRLCRFCSYNRSECNTHIMRSHPERLRCSGPRIDSFITDLSRQAASVRSLKKRQTLDSRRREGQDRVERAGTKVSRSSGRRRIGLRQRASAETKSGTDWSTPGSGETSKAANVSSRNSKPYTPGTFTLGARVATSTSSSADVTNNVAVSSSSRKITTPTSSEGSRPKPSPPSVFNISTRNSPRKFDTRPYPRPPSSSINTRKGSHVKPPVSSFSLNLAQVVSQNAQGTNKGSQVKPHVSSFSHNLTQVIPQGTSKGSHTKPPVSSFSQNLAQVIIQNAEDSQTIKTVTEVLEVTVNSDSQQLDCGGEQEAEKRATRSQKATRHDIVDEESCVGHTRVAEKEEGANHSARPRPPPASNPVELVGSSHGAAHVTFHNAKEPFSTQSQLAQPLHGLNKGQSTGDTDTTESRKAKTEIEPLSEKSNATVDGAELPWQLSGRVAGGDKQEVAILKTGLLEMETLPDQFMSDDVPSPAAMETCDGS